MMELAVALLLRARGMHLSDVAEALTALRPKLIPIYEIAYREGSTGRGAPVFIYRQDAEDDPILFEGIYLDLRLHKREDGNWAYSRPVKPLSPWEAIMRLRNMGHAITYRGFIALTEIARGIVSGATNAPEIKAGRSRQRQNGQLK